MLIAIINLIFVVNKLGLLDRLLLHQAAEEEEEEEEEEDTDSEFLVLMIT
jgi:hypothetical protein